MQEISLRFGNPKVDEHIKPIPEEFLVELNADNLKVAQKLFDNNGLSIKNKDFNKYFRYLHKIKYQLWSFIPSEISNIINNNHTMAEIINHNPEDNPRLNEIYEILLLAGYFRIRISSLKAFDKVIGGIAWCITSSNFEIEVEYND